jgi:hypothetical protein
MTYKGLHRFWQFILCGFIGNCLTNLALYELTGTFPNLVLFAVWLVVIGSVMQFRYFRPRPQLPSYNRRNFAKYQPKLEAWK